MVEFLNRVLPQPIARVSSFPRMHWAFVNNFCRTFRASSLKMKTDAVSRSAGTSSPSSCHWPSSPSSASQLNAFLARSRSRLIPVANSTEAHLFLGNEGADMDSIVSAITLAYASERDGMTGCASVINCVRSDLHLRGDVVLALSAAGIDIDSLVFIDEVDAFDGIPSVTLVDHNEPATHQRALSSNVSGIVDHHADSRMFLDANPRIVELVGSCSTLVAELYPDVFSGEHFDATAASLVLSAILIDTRNLAGGTQRDKECVERISNRLELKEKPRATLFAALFERKMAQGHLSTVDLLRRDYKRFEGGSRKVGISSVGISLGSWSSRNLGPSHELTVAGLQSWATGQGIDVLLAMTHFEADGEYRRELLICPSSDENDVTARSISRGLANELPRLKLDSLDIGSLAGTQVLTYRQGDSGFSRKKIAPAVISCLERL